MGGLSQREPSRKQYGARPHNLPTSFPNLHCGDTTQEAGILVDARGLLRRPEADTNLETVVTILTRLLECEMSQPGDESIVRRSWKVDDVL